MKPTPIEYLVIALILILFIVFIGSAFEHHRQFKIRQVNEFNAWTKVSGNTNHLTLEEYLAFKYQ
ncbi:MAG: hypothetical protein EKK57_11380 [Proteobacteria bacterium]|nr:MAG: hypothetical protein EKK57_11380 [Pseudomonadota bacterium]